MIMLPSFLELFLFVNVRVDICSHVHSLVYTLSKNNKSQPALILITE